MAILLAIALVLAAIAFISWHLTGKSRKHWKIPARIAAVAVGVVSVLILLLFLGVGAMCGHYDFPPVSSPDGQLLAQVTEEDCGAVDRFHSSVQLWSKQRFSYFAKRKTSATIFMISHDPRLLRIEWQDPNRLLIRYPNDHRSDEEFQCESQWHNVRIECAGYTPDYSKPVPKMPDVRRLFW